MWWFGRGRPVVSVLRLHGVIGQVGPMRRGLTLANQAGLIERAFGYKTLVAVALSINSPGGSPVQSTLIHNRIRQKAAEQDVPVLVFVEDVAASGGYMLACAGDEIFVDASSIVGSIGVISAGFGFVGLLEKLGVERRLHTAGKNKGMLDPFRPEDADDVRRLKAIQGDIHETFTDLVRGRRGKRLKQSEDELFSGAVWAGKKAVDQGLADGLGDLRGVLRDRFGDKVQLHVVTGRKSLLRSILPFGSRHRDPAEQAGRIADGMLAAVEERALWSRFGL